MAPKRPTPMEVPPAASSSEEEEESSSDGGEEESSEEEEEEEAAQKQSQKSSSAPQQKQTQIQKPSNTKPEPSSTRKPESESDSDSESRSSEADSDEAEPVKPISSKPIEETTPPPPVTKKPRSKASPVSAARSTVAVKRGSETGQEQKDSKRVKPDAIGERSEETKKLFQRVWSLEDEVAVLKGYLDFVEKTGSDPAKDMSGFYEFVKNSLQCDVNLGQVRDKISTIKRRFAKHVEKSKKGVEMTFSKPHDQEVFELWKKIWGGESGLKANGSVKKSSENNGSRRGSSSKRSALLKAESLLDEEEEKNEAEKVDKVEKNVAIKEAVVNFDKSSGGSGVEDFVMKKGLDMLEGAKRTELEKKWRKLQLEELELYLKRNALLKEQAELMLAALKAEED